jgi:hypothetical protein
MPLSRRQPETQDPYLVVARPTAALLDANNQITAEVPDSIRLLYKMGIYRIKGTYSVEGDDTTTSPSPLTAPTL